MPWSVRVDGRDYTSHLLVSVHLEVVICKVYWLSWDVAFAVVVVGGKQ